MTATAASNATVGENISLMQHDDAAHFLNATSGSAFSTTSSIISSIPVIGTVGTVAVASVFAAFTKVEDNDAFAVRIMKITWGKFDGKPACLIGVEIVLDPGSRRILKTARFTLGNLSEIPADQGNAVSGSTAVTSRKCRLTLWEPVSHEGLPVKKAVKRGGALEPKANVLGNEISIGSLNYSEDFDRTYRGTIQSKLLAGEDGNVTGVVWTLRANKAESSGVQHCTNVALLVQHTGQPFTLEFSSHPPPESRYAFWKRKQVGVSERRAFIPKRSSEVLDGTDLKQFVKGTIVP